MSEHMTEWLNAYLDGELNNYQQTLVKAHIDTCQTCQTELESLVNLSNVLHEDFTPGFTSPKRFAAQVNLRLPRQQTEPSKNRSFEITWWAIPVGLLGAWIFISTAFLVGDILSVASGWGILSSMSDWLVIGSSNQGIWSATLGQFGVLSGNTLDWATRVEAFTRTSLPKIIIEASIALLYLSWIAVWWSRHHRQQHGQLLER